MIRVSKSLDWYLSLKLECKLDTDMRIEMIMSDGCTSESEAIALIFNDRMENEKKKPC